MPKTRAEVRAWFESKVGTTVADKSNPKLNGQCVALQKALLEFLGVPDPYAARGNAKDYGDALIRQGIGTEGRGWLTICISRIMGVIGGDTYGHVWDSLQDEANYEQNGARALVVTKNTRPLSQAQQFINLDKWIKEEGENMPEKINKDTGKILLQYIAGRNKWRTGGDALGGAWDGEVEKFQVGQPLTNAHLMAIHQGEGQTNLDWTNKAGKALEDQPKLQAKIKELEARVKDLESQGPGDFVEVGNKTGLYQKKESK